MLKSGKDIVLHIEVCLSQARHLLEGSVREPKVAQAMVWLIRAEGLLGLFSPCAVFEPSGKIVRMNDHGLKTGEANMLDKTCVAFNVLQDTLEAKRQELAKPSPILRP